MMGATERLKREAERDIALAHTIASFSRAKKLQPLTQYLKPKRGKQVGGTMLDKVKRLAAATRDLG